MPWGTPFPLRRTLAKLLHACTLFAYFYTHFVDLRTTWYPLSRGLGNPSEVCGTLLRVGEVPELQDLNFPVLLDEREDRERIVLVRGTIDGGAHPCGLRHGGVLWSETTWWFCEGGQTWVTTLPGASITS